ncbi:MAG: hypothetical protein Ct9H300mP11_01620 [Chloroflexota bacterium]|nr:MAG: hypothetical protein Ct9H300mP11_01620 [Chloroflexota bacterium]
MGRPPVIDGPHEKIIDAMIDNGSWIIGDPDDCVAGIRRLEERSGGFGDSWFRQSTGRNESK